MTPWMPQFRFFIPLLLTSSMSFLLCGAVAVFLLREQTQSVDALGETIASYRAAAKLEESLLDLIALLRNRNERLKALHERIDQHLDNIKKYANTKDEIDAYDELFDSFSAYRIVWLSLENRRGEQHEIARAEAIRVLETETLPACQE